MNKMKLWFVMLKFDLHTCKLGILQNAEWICNHVLQKVNAEPLHRVGEGLRCLQNLISPLFSFQLFLFHHVTLAWAEA